MERAVREFLVYAVDAKDIVDMNIAAGAALESLDERTPRGVAGKAILMAALYGVAVSLTCFSVLLMAALETFSDVSTYSPLIAAVAVVVWVAGLGPALLSIVVGWSGSLLHFVVESSAPGDSTRWAAALAATLAMTMAFSYLQKRRQSWGWLRAS